MIITDFHTHTCFCDGKNISEDMVKSAIDKGISALGLSVHTYTAFDPSYCVKKEDTAVFIAEVKRLKRQYADKITLFVGGEVDAFAETPSENFDYLIGSCHYVKVGERYYDVDASPEATRRAIEEGFSGDAPAYAEAYFETLSTIGRHKPSIIGHFDLLTKFNELDPMIDTASPRYQVAWKRAADKLLLLGVPFEINTGAISRGFRREPYPAADILSYLAERGASFILSSDAHAKENLGFGFAEAKAFAEASGVTNFVQFPKF